MLRAFVSVILVASVTARALAAPTPEGNQLFPRGSNENDEHSTALSLNPNHFSVPPVEQRSTESPSGSSACKYMRCLFGMAETFDGGKCRCPSMLSRRQVEHGHPGPAPPFPLISKREANPEAENGLEERKILCAFKITCNYLSHAVRRNGVCVCEPSRNKKRHLSQSPEIGGPKHLNLDKRDQSVGLESRNEAGKCGLKKYCPKGQYGYLTEDGQCICPKPGPEHPRPGKRDLAAASEAGSTASENLKVGNGNDEVEDNAAHSEDTKSLGHAVSSPLLSHSLPPTPTPPPSFLAKRRFTDPVCHGICPATYHLELIGSTCNCIVDKGAPDAQPSFPVTFSNADTGDGGKPKPHPLENKWWKLQRPPGVKRALKEELLGGS